MRTTRVALGVVGVAGICWGAWLLSDDGSVDLRSTALFLVGVVVVHDAVLAPVVVMLGVVATKALPRRFRVSAALGFLVWGTLTLAVANVLSGRGGKPGMDSLLHRPYLTAWLVLTGALLIGVVATVTIRTRGRRAVDA